LAYTDYQGFSGNYAAKDGSGVWVMSGAPAFFPGPILPSGGDFSPSPFTPSEADIRSRIIDPIVNDLAVFLIELKDLKSLWDTVKLGISRPDKSWLGYQLGAVPLVADLIRLYNGLRNFEAKWDSLRSRTNKPIKLQFRQVYPTKTISEVVYQSSLAKVTCNVRRRSVGVTTLRVIYDLPPLSFMQGFLEASSLLGFNPSLATAWELVPFSFVVDWFIPLGDIFDDLSLNLLGLKLKSADGTQSVKTEWTASWEHTAKYFVGDPSVRILSGAGKSYQRTVIDAVSIFQSAHGPGGGLNVGSRLLTAAALITSRRG